MRWPSLVLAVAVVPAVFAEEAVDLGVMTRIRDEGFHRSEVMETAAQLTDVIGPRLTNSPGQRRASEWTRKQLETWGLAGARVEPWGSFGRGWTFDRCVVTLVAPETRPLIALPKAWTPGTAGNQTARALRVKLDEEADLEKWKGRVRGIYLQENAAVAPVFEAWLKPFADLGAHALTMRKTGSTDHVPFDAVGLPGFQFIQDEIDYRAIPDFELFGTHHTNMDTYDRLQREDLMQASVIMAAFVWNAANREALLPRKPLPRDP